MTGVCFQADTHCFFSCGKDGALRYWDADRGEPVLLLAGHRGAVWGVALSHEGSLLASVGQDRSIRLWRRGDDLVFVEEEK